MNEPEKCDLFHKGDPRTCTIFIYEAQIEGLQVFSVIKITVVRQVRMSPASTAAESERDDKHA